MSQHDHHEASGLARALGITSGAKVAVVNEPDGWLELLSPLPRGARLFERASEPLDVIVYFSDERANVARRVPVFAGFLAADGSLWSAVPDSGADVDPVTARAIATSCGLTVHESLTIAPGWTATRLAHDGDQQSDATRG